MWAQAHLHVCAWVNMHAYMTWQQAFTCKDICMHKQVCTCSLSKLTHTVLRGRGFREGWWPEMNGEGAQLQRIFPILHPPFSSCPSPPQPTQQYHLQLLTSSSSPSLFAPSSPLWQSSSPHWVYDEPSLYTASQRPFSYPKPSSRVLWTPGWLPPWEEFCCQLFR